MLRRRTMNIARPMPAKPKISRGSSGVVELLLGLSLMVLVGVSVTVEPAPDAPALAEAPAPGAPGLAEAPAPGAPGGVPLTMLLATLAEQMIRAPPPLAV